MTREHCRHRLRLSAIVVAWCAALVGGCATPPGDAGSGQVSDAPGATGIEVVAPQPRIDLVSLMLTPPVALNWDDDPTPDGVRIRTYFFQTSPQTRAVALQRGAVEYILWDGNVPDEDLHATDPALVWPHTAGSLRTFHGQTQVGVGYVVPLEWEDAGPQSRLVTISARLLRPDDAPLYARPVRLNMVVK